MIRELKTASEVIDFCGGTVATAEMVAAHIPHVRKQNVSNWRRDARLPPETYLIFKVKLGRRAKAPARLWGIVDPAIAA
jgi:hypothetical protein